MPRFDDSDLAADLTQVRSPRDARPSVGGITASDGTTLPIPADPHHGRRESEVVEVPATRSSISDAAQYMHNLSLNPSMRSWVRYAVGTKSSGCVTIGGSDARGSSGMRRMILYFSGSRVLRGLIFLATGL